MKVVALISGGKDSCYNMMQCVSEGHDIIALANLKPKDKDELDSYMYQSVGHHAIDLYADAMGLPLYRREITGSSLSIGRDYVRYPADEVEDLFELLKQVKDKLEIEGVAVGAILSNYQRVRVEDVCQRLGLTSLAYLWRRDQTELLEEMIQCQVKAIIIKVAAMGLQPKLHLGKTLEEIQPHLLKKKAEFDLNVCGEGGEFETFTLDCPLFKKEIVIDESEFVIHSDDAFAPVGYLNLKKAHLMDKNETCPWSFYDAVKELPMKNSRTIMPDLFPNIDSLQCVDCSQVENPTSSDRILGDIKPNILQRGNHLWISGVMAVNNGDTDIETLTIHIMDKLKSLVLSCGPGWDMSCLVLVHLYVKNMANFLKINTVYKSYFGLNPAARAFVQTDLPENVEFLLDCFGYSCHDDRETMHVQGLSHWAPANIGPYSQCIKIQKDIYVAGQIAMIPANLSIIEGGIHSQSRLSLQHANSILTAMATGCSVNNVKSCVCYVTHKGFIQIAKQEFHSAMKEQSHNLCSSVIYVVVPVLPKSALIEWQIVAINETPQEIKEDRMIKSCENAKLVIKFIHQENIDDRRNSLLSLSGHVYRENGSLSVVNLSEIAEIIHSSLQEITSLTGDDQMPMLRIFYSSSVFKYEDLISALHDILTTVCFTVIPVLQLEDDTMALSLCVT